MKLLYPKPGYVEIDPDELWRIIVNVVKVGLTGKLLSSNMISNLLPLKKKEYITLSFFSVS